MNPNWTNTISNWPQDMKTQLKEAIEAEIASLPRFNDLTITEILATGSRLFGGMRNGNRLREKISDLDIQLYCEESLVSWAVGFEYHGVHVTLNIKTKPLNDQVYVPYAMGHKKRSIGFNLPTYSLNTNTLYGQLDHPHIELWRNRNS